MKAFLIVALLIVLFFWGGPAIAIAFFTFPLFFVVALLALATWKIVDLFAAR
jgi:hypothetical protein